MTTSVKYGQGNWTHLQLPFKPGKVYPYQTGWCFTFVAADGYDYYNRTNTWPSAAKAKEEMRKFITLQNEGSK